MSSESVPQIATTTALAQIFPIAISWARTGMTRRCSIVPRSRSRITAAPTSKMVSIVTFSMSASMALYQTPSRFGLKKARSTLRTGISR